MQSRLDQGGADYALHSMHFLSRFQMASKCQRCGKSVYQAEERIGAGAKWHRHCFTCKDCNKGLDSNTVRERKESRKLFIMA